MITKNTILIFVLNEGEKMKISAINQNYTFKRANTKTHSTRNYTNKASYNKEQKTPMAGTILDVKVSVGQQVNAGDVICILEAMKLENEVVAEFSGVVKSIAVSKGTAVQNGQVLVVIG